MAGAELGDGVAVLGLGGELARPGGDRGWGIALEMICLQPAEVSDLAQLRQPFVGRAGGDPHADPGQCDAVPGGA